jgi:GAF domain-containing protein
MLDEPKATRRMHALAQAVEEPSHLGSLLERALEGAMSLIGGDLGNVQLRKLTNAGLRIAAQCGFGNEFLEYFEFVEDDTSACGRAASQRSQTVIFDVTEDAAFAPHRDIAAASRFRAVQSTPLLDPTGRLRGVISTHYQHPHQPGRRDLRLMQWYAERVAATIASRQHQTTTLYDATPARHPQTADPHVAATARINHSAPALDGNGNGANAHPTRQRARRAVEQARHERERAHAVAERARDQKTHYLAQRYSPDAG